MSGCRYDHTGRHTLGLLAAAGDALLINAVEVAVEHTTTGISDAEATRALELVGQITAHSYYNRDGLVSLDTEDYELLRTALHDASRYLHRQGYQRDESYPEECWAARVLGSDADVALHCYTRQLNTSGKGAVLRQLAADTGSLPNPLPWKVST